MSKPMLNATASRRRFLESVAGGAAAAAVGGFPGRAIAAASELNILFPGGTWKDWFEQSMVTPFADQRGIKIVWKTGLGFEPLIIAQRAPSAMGPHSSEPEHVEPARGDERRARVEGGSHPQPEEDPPVVPLSVLGRQGAHALRRLRSIPSVSRSRSPPGSISGIRSSPARSHFPDWVWVGEEVFHAINVVAGGDAENVDPGIDKLKELFKTNKAQIINNVEHTKQLLVAEEVWICARISAPAPSRPRRPARRSSSSSPRKAASPGSGIPRSSPAVRRKASSSPRSSSTTRSMPRSRSRSAGRAAIRRPTWR